MIMSNLKRRVFLSAAVAVMADMCGVVCAEGSTVVDDHRTGICMHDDDDTHATVDIDEVVVSANKSVVSRKDAPVVVNVISSRLLEQLNAPDLAKTLSFQSGLRVENNCQNCGFPQVRINGLEGPYSQILINSRPVVSALAGVYGLEQIPAAMVDRIEVVRGGGSALFGANAVGGTINIITKDPKSNCFEVGNSLSSVGGKAWEDNMSANASIVGRDNEYGLSLYQTYRNRQQYDHDGDGFSELGKLSAHTFGLNGYYRPSHYTRFGIEYHTTNEFRRGGNKFDLEPHLTDITEQTRHVINSGGLTYDMAWKEWAHKLSLFSSVQHIDRNSYYGAQQDPNAYGKTKDLTYVGGATYIGRFSRLLFSPALITAGVEYQYNTLHDIMTGYNRDLQQDVSIASVYGQGEWNIRRFTLLLGLRLDSHNLIDNPIVSPRINMMWKPSDNLQTRLTWSTGFRAPQAYDEDLHVTAVGGEGVLIRLADGLKPEYSNSFSGSADWTFRRGHFVFNILGEAFFTSLADVFCLQNIGIDQYGNTVQERRNGDGAYVYGVNIEARATHGGDFSLQAGATVQRSRYKSLTSWSEDPTVTLIRDMPRSPDVYGYFTMNIKPAKRLDLSLSGVYTGRMFVPHFGVHDEMVHTPDFVELSAKVAYIFRLGRHLDMQLNCGVQNIFNAFQRDHDRGEFRDSGYFYGPAQPRTIFLGFKVTGS